MFDCPNCGEPVDNSSTFCSHCGSDAETGWKPDVDYYSLELPEDDEFDYREQRAYVEDRGARIRAVIGPALVGICLTLFVVVGYAQYGIWVIAPTLLLTVMTPICLNWPGKPED